MNDRKVVIVHFRKAEAKHGLPWTIHYKGKCIPASTVRFDVPVETVFKPEKKSNPRAWVRALGEVIVDPKYDNFKSSTHYLVF